MQRVLILYRATGTERDKSGDSDNQFNYIAAGAGGGTLLVVSVVLLVCICFYCLCNVKQSTLVDVEMASAKYESKKSQSLSPL